MTVNERRALDRVNVLLDTLERITLLIDQCDNAALRMAIRREIRDVCQRATRIQPVYGWRRFLAWLRLEVR